MPSSSDSAAVDTWVWLCTRAEMNAERAAANAAAVAARHERLVTEGTDALRQLHSRMAVMHRRIECRHRTAARMHRAQGERMSKTRSPGFVVPELLGVVARAIGARCAALTLLGLARYEESAMASDRTAATALELEFTLGEGPAHDAADSGLLVVADEEAMSARWANYAPAVTELGVRSVAAAPLRLNRTCVGVLTAFDPPGARGEVTVDGVVEVLVHTVLAAGSTGEWSLTGADDRKVVHQASGMIAARLRCSPADALAVLRARAFADNVGIGVLARQVVDREVVFE